MVCPLEENPYDQAVEKGIATEYHFLPMQTWKNLNCLVLGLVVTIEFYCIKLGYELVPRKFNTDPCENHFANARRERERDTCSTVLHVHRTAVLLIPELAWSRIEQLWESNEAESSNHQHPIASPISHGTPP